MDRDVPAGRILEVFVAFLKLGLTAFGGPVAHLGYFREAFVRRRAWLDEATYAELVAVSQFLPGPASSQTAFGIGLLRAGVLGGGVAWVAFTLPSAVLMTALAFVPMKALGPLGQGVIHGLKLVAVAVVAQAVWGMARTLTPDLRRALIALAALAIVTLASAAIGQVAAIALGAVAGLLVCRGPVTIVGETRAWRLPKGVAIAALGLLLILLIGGPILADATGQTGIVRFDAFYRSGALVFGGGHVVLPLLQQAVVDPGWIDQDAFIAGYGAAQALPGPLFTFAAYLGAAMPGAPNGVPGAILALVAIFLPGILALLAALPFWASLRERPAVQAAMRGANAAVVGILAAALYNPVWTGAVRGWTDIAAATAGVTLLTRFRAPPLVVVLLGVGWGAAQALVG